MVYNCLRSSVSLLDTNLYNDEASLSVQPWLDELVWVFQGDETSQLSSIFYDVLKVADQHLYENWESLTVLFFC